MAELAFEKLLAALEVTAGTAVNPPTHYLNLAGTITPEVERYRPNESRGTLAEYYRSQVIKKWSSFSAEGPLDVFTLPVLLQTLVKGGVTTPTTPADGIDTRLWTFEPSMTADDLQAMTLYSGDPNVQMFQAAYAQIDSLTITADASGNEGVKVSISGQGKFPSKTAPSSTPAMLNAPLLAPSAMQLWLDTETIGTTAIEGRVVSTEVTIPVGRSRNWLAAGPDGDLGYTNIGRAKRHAEMRVVFEFADDTQYDQWVAETVLKGRLRLNGPAIETVGEPAVTYYNYAEMDIYGPFDTMSWGELEGTNRTIEMAIQSEYDPVAGHDFAMRVQNSRTTL